MQQETTQNNLDDRFNAVADAINQLSDSLDETQNVVEQMHANAGDSFNGVKQKFDTIVKNANDKFKQIKDLADIAVGESESNDAFKKDINFKIDVVSGEIKKFKDSLKSSNINTKKEVDASLLRFRQTVGSGITNILKAMDLDSTNLVNGYVIAWDSSLNKFKLVAPSAITLTTGSVAFGGSSGQVAQDNANLFFDDTNNRLGVGTNTPETVGHIQGINTAMATNNAGIFSIGTPQKSGAYKSRILFGIDNTTLVTTSGQGFIQAREIQSGTNITLSINPNGGGVSINTIFPADTSIGLLVGNNPSSNGYIKIRNSTSFGGGSTPYSGYLFQQSGDTYTGYTKAGIIYDGYDTTGGGLGRGRLLFALNSAADATNVQDTIVASTRMNIDYTTGAVAVGKGVTIGTAKLHLGAGTATVNTAPLKIDAGVALATTEDGAIEYHSSHLYFTVGSTRYQLDQQGGTGANALGTYIVQTATNAPANGQVLASLSTGIIKNTTTTGVLSIAVAGDFPTLNQNTTGTSAGLTGTPNITVATVASSGVTVGGVTVPTISSTSTLTNKRVTKRVVVTTQSATPVINTDNTDISQITGLAQAITSMSSSLSGTPVAGDMLMIQITDNGTARAITWGASFASTTIPLPTTTVASTMLRVLFQRNNANTVWDCIGAV